jgi:hypothetical protein
VCAISRREQATLQWLQNGSHLVEDYMNSTRREASGTIRTKETEYLKDRINKLETKKKNIRDFTEAYMYFRRLTYFESTCRKMTVLTNFHRILNRWKNLFFQILNVHGMFNFSIKQTESNTGDQVFMSLLLMRLRFQLNR